MPLQRNEAFGMALDSDKELLQKFRIFFAREQVHAHGCSRCGIIPVLSAFCLLLNPVLLVVLVAMQCCPEVV